MKNKRLNSLLIVVVLSIILGSFVYAEGEVVDFDDGVEEVPTKPVSVAVDFAHAEDDLEAGMVLDMVSLVIFDARLGDFKVPITFEVNVENGEILEGALEYDTGKFAKEEVKDSHTRKYTLDPTKLEGDVAEYGSLSIDLDVKVGEVSEGETFKVTNTVHIGDDLLDVGEFIAKGGTNVIAEYTSEDDNVVGDVDIPEGADEEYNKNLGIEEIPEEELDEVLEDEFERLEEKEEEMDKQLEESEKEFEEEQEKKKTKRAGAVATFATLVVLFSIAYVKKKNEDVDEE